MKSFRHKLALWSIAVLIVVGGVGAWLAAETFSTSSQWALLFQVVDIIKTHYINKDVKTEDLIQGAIEGTLKALDDPYSRYLPPKGYSEMRIRLEGELTGIGIEIGLKDDHLTVIAPIEGSPAAKAGLLTMDRILAVDGQSMSGVGLQEAVSKIRGPLKSKVVLTIERPGKEKPFDVTIIREIIKINSVDRTNDFDGIGYIRLNSFESKAADDEVRDAIAKLSKDKPLKALIVDLRFNGGGLLDNAVNIASFFIKDGAVVHTVNREGVRETLSVDGSPIFKEQPLIILINEASASASEILAGAVQDHKRGTVMGQHSFGKASVQNIFTLADGSAVLVTIAHYLTPNGSDIHKKGIMPDIVVDIPTENITKMREPGYVYSYADDTQIQEAIKYLKTKI